MIDKEILLGDYQTKLLICPRCKKGLMKENEEKSHNLKDIKIAEPHFALEYNMHESSEKLRSSLYECEQSDCDGELVLIEEEKGELNPKNQPFYVFEYEPYIYKRTIKYMNPSVDIIEIPNQLDEKMSEILRSSFILFWIDEDSCGNKIRSAIEKLLDIQKVNKTTINKKGKRQKLNLHQRIEKFKDKKAEIAKYLLALKWIGNQGSHNGKYKLTKSELIDAYEILELSLADLYDKTRVNVDKLTKKINKAKRHKTS